MKRFTTALVSLPVALAASLFLGYLLDFDNRWIGTLSTLVLVGTWAGIRKD